MSKSWLGVTYLLYVVWWDAVLFGGAGYVVFWLDRSPWWFLLAVILSGCSYTPGQWIHGLPREEVK